MTSRAIAVKAPTHRDAAFARLCDLHLVHRPTMPWAGTRDAAAAKVARSLSIRLRKPFDAMIPMDVGNLEKRSAAGSDFHAMVFLSVPMIEPSQVMVFVPLDADLVAHFQSDAEAGGWQQHINGVLRFYMETNRVRDADFEAVMHRPGPV